MTSKVAALYVATPNNLIRAGSLQPGSLVFIGDDKENIGLITSNFEETIDLISLRDQTSWSNLHPDLGPEVTPLPAGSQVILEAVSVEINQEVRTSDVLSSGSNRSESEANQEAGSPTGQSGISIFETIQQILQQLDRAGEDGSALQASDSEGAEEGEEVSERQVYFGFADYDDMITSFAPNEDDIVPSEDEVLLASYGGYSSEGDAFVLFRLDENQLYEVHGSHCSCHGLENQWEAEETTVAAIEMRPVRDGEFLFLHEHSYETSEALLDVLEQLKSEGFV